MSIHMMLYRVGKEGCNLFPLTCKVLGTRTFTANPIFLSFLEAANLGDSLNC